MRTDYRRVNGLGSAREGTGHFIRQRLTGLANIPLSLFMIWLVITAGGAGASEIGAILSNPVAAALAILLMVSFSWHVRIGVQVVIEDYVHSEGLKLAALIANAFVSIGLAAIGIISVLKLGFGG